VETPETALAGRNGNPNRVLKQIGCNKPLYFRYLASIYFVPGFEQMASGAALEKSDASGMHRFSTETVPVPGHLNSNPEAPIRSLRIV
jgi:hypothetical protein